MFSSSIPYSFFILFVSPTGELKDIGSSPFWYDAYISASGSTYSRFGGDPSLMDSMTSFSNSEYSGDQCKTN